MKTTTKLFLAFWLVFTAFYAKAQVDPYEKLKKEMEAEFDQYASQNQKIFNDYVDKIDKEFSEHLRKTWEAYEHQVEEKAYPKPKPDELPPIEPMEIDDDPEPVPIVEEPDEPDYPDKNEKPRKKIPPIQKEENQDEYNAVPVQLMFYGTPVSFQYDAMLAKPFTGSEINENAIADYWDAMANTAHYSLVNQLQETKNHLVLNDWGYYQLLRKAAQKIVPNSVNSQRLLTWFLLSKSRYKARVGFKNANVYILLASVNMMYATSYYTFGDLRYFVMDEKVNNMRIYKEDYADAIYPMDFSLPKPLNLASDVGNKKITFNYVGNSYNFNFQYNKNVINFFKDYPRLNIETYFNSAVSREAKLSFLENLKKVVENRSEREAVGFLLALSQRAFDYKTDPQQFGYEKFFFPEEVLYYPYSDCEDRSVFFAYIVRLLLETDIVGLKYPGHIATAVDLGSNAEGDWVNYNGRHFIVADPTYINAPVGMCMPRFLETQAEIVKIKHQPSQNENRKQVWDIVAQSGGAKAANEESSTTDANGNTYVTGYFDGAASFGSHNLNPVNQTRDAFVAKYNPKGEIVWVETITGEGNETGMYVKLDQQGNCYIAGEYDKEFEQKGIKMTSNGYKNIFVAKLSPTGNLLWINRAQIDKLPTKNDQIFVSRFEPDGKHLVTVPFEQTENFESYGIRFDKGNCLVTTAISAIPGGDDLAFNEGADAKDLTNLWISETKKLIAQKYEASIAGIFAFLKTMQRPGTSVEGKAVQKAIDTYNPDFKNNNPEIYKNFGKIKRVTNSSGIIKVFTHQEQNVQFYKLKIKDTARLRMINYKNGDARIDVLTGASVGKAFIQFQLNYMKLYKTSGDVLFDYDDDHTQQRVNLKRDVLN